MSRKFEDIVGEHLEVIGGLKDCGDVIEAIAAAMTSSLKGIGKICFMGNGGSAADSQHLAAEFVGRFQLERRALPSIAFTTDTSILTAVANDYGYEAVFERQVEALVTADDVVVGISTSGYSPNVVRAMRKAEEIGACTVGFTGGSGGELAKCCEHCPRGGLRPKLPGFRKATFLRGTLSASWSKKRSCPERPIKITSESFSRLGFADPSVALCGHSDRVAPWECCGGGILFIVIFISGRR